MLLRLCHDPWVQIFDAQSFFMLAIIFGLEFRVGVTTLLLFFTSDANGRMRAEQKGME